MPNPFKKGLFRAILFALSTKPIPIKSIIINKIKIITAVKFFKIFKKITLVNIFTRVIVFYLYFCV